jgi:hypothetical protein
VSTYLGYQGYTLTGKVGYIDGLFTGCRNADTVRRANNEVRINEINEPITPMRRGAEPEVA